MLRLFTTKIWIHRATPRRDSFLHAQPLFQIYWCSFMAVSLSGIYACITLVFFISTTSFRLYECRFNSRDHLVQRTTRLARKMWWDAQDLVCNHSFSHWHSPPFSRPTAHCLFQLFNVMANRLSILESGFALCTLQSLGGLDFYLKNLKGGSSWSPNIFKPYHHACQKTHFYIIFHYNKNHIVLNHVDDCRCDYGYRLVLFIFLWWWRRIVVLFVRWNTARKRTPKTIYPPIGRTPNLLVKVQEGQSLLWLHKSSQPH